MICPVGIVGEKHKTRIDHCARKSSKRVRDFFSGKVGKVRRMSLSCSRGVLVLLNTKSITVRRPLTSTVGGFELRLRPWSPGGDATCVPSPASSIEDGGPTRSASPPARHRVPDECRNHAAWFLFPLRLRADAPWHRH